MTDTLTTAEERALVSLKAAIERGDFDKLLDQVEATIKTRKRKIDEASRTYENYPVGSKVRFNDRVAPKYLQFAQATVISHNRSRGGKYQVEVELDYTTGKFRAGHPIRAMFSIIDPVK